MLSPKQLRLVRPSEPVTLAHGSIRSGKTLAELIAFVDWIANQAPPGPLAIIGVTRDTINRNLLEQLDLLDPAICSWSPYGNTCQIMGRTVHRISSNDSKAETKIRGLTLAGALLDEATLVHEATFIQLLGRLSIPGARLFATTNPDNPAHWLKTKYINRADELGWNVQHFTMRDNPGLTPEYVEAKEREFTGLYYRRFIRGEWVAAEGAVYPDFDRDKHIIPFLDLPPARMALSIGIDYGTTNASSAITLYLGEDNRLYLTDEWRIDQGTRLAAMTDAELSRSFTTWLAGPHHPTARHPFSQFFVDPAAASFKTQLHRDGVRHVKNANNNVGYGIKLVASLIAADRLRVSDKCTGLLEEIGGYRWDQKAAERGEDKPVKQDDHCLVAGTLVTTDNGPTPIESIKPGMRVLTRAGWRAVTDAWQVSAAAPVLTVETTAGRVLTGTGNHRVWVAGRGWTRIDALRYWDILEVCPNESTASSSKEQSSADTPTQPTPQTVTITRQESKTVSEAGNGSTSRYGRTQTSNRSHQGTTSTTSTGTLSTMTPPTSPSYPAPSTSHSTHGNATQTLSTPNKYATTSTRSGHSRSSGTPATKGSPGILSRAARHGRNESTLPQPANNAGPTTNLYSPDDSAPEDVKQHTGEPPAPTTNSEPASNAEPSSPSAGTRNSEPAHDYVASVTAAGTAPVYDLTVDGEHEFYANQLLVHNSVDAARYAITSSESWWRRYIPSI